MNVGVLAIQGGFNAHMNAVRAYGHHAIPVRNATELDGIDLLILPGGESTTMLKLIPPDLEEKIKDFVTSGKKLFVTCAGLILVAEEVENPSQRSFSLVPIQISRNAYGRQINSFITDHIQTSGSLKSKTPYLTGTFIRAPKITKINDDRVEILAYNKEEPVCIRYQNIIGCTFHPELDPEKSAPLYSLIFS